MDNALNWVLDEGKIFSQSEKARLRRVARLRNDVAMRWGKKAAVREWLIVDLALSTGLRVSEIAALDCGDIYLDSRKPYLIVMCGKGGKRRVVRFGENLKRHLLDFMQWKKGNNENIDNTAPFLLSSNTKDHLTVRAVQKNFERALANANIRRHSIHHCRHSYATDLLIASGNNLRLVQQQLGHSSVKVTEIYTHILDKQMDKAVQKLDEFLN